MDYALLPHEIRNRVIKDKSDIIKYVERTKCSSSFASFTSLINVLEDIAIVGIDSEDSNKLIYYVDYDILRFHVVYNKVKDTMKIHHKIDVYFQTKDVNSVKRYKNKIGKYNVQDIDGVTYWVICKEYDWSRINT